MPISATYSLESLVFFNQFQLNQSPKWIKLLAAMASFFVVTLILGSILIICNSESKQHRRRRSYLVAPKPNPSPSICDSFDPSLPHVSMQELIAATQGFSKDLIIGDGSFGLVYKVIRVKPIVTCNSLNSTQNIKIPPPIDNEISNQWIIRGIGYVLQRKLKLHNGNRNCEREICRDNPSDLRSLGHKNITQST